MPSVPNVLTTDIRRYVPGISVDERVAMITTNMATCSSLNGSAAYSGNVCASSSYEFYHADRQGNVIAMVDAAGVQQARYVYTPYGVEEPYNNSGNPYRYTGRRLEAEWGIFNYRARYYDPALGRFYQTDPVLYADQFNLYAYVGNDPLNATDPSGEDGIRLVDETSAYGQGHSAFAVSDESGETEIGEYGLYDPDDANGDGSNAVLREIPGMPSSVETDGNGDITFSGMEEIVSAFGDNYGIDQVNVSHFPEADNLDGARGEIAEVQDEIASGEDYDLFSCNCDDIASRVLTAAGANNVVEGIRPNAVSRQERTGAVADRPAGGRWSGSWRRQDNGRWGYRPGQ